jgi:Ca-activated chloride channel family protein
MEKRAFEQRSFSEFESSFQWFVGIAILLLVLEFLMPYRSSGKGRNQNLFGENA